MEEKQKRLGTQPSGRYLEAPAERPR